MKKVLIYIVVGAVLYYLLKKFLKRKKYENYFIKELGFGDKYLSKFTTDELVTIYSYLKNYSRKGIVLTQSVSPEFYNKVVAVNNKAFNIYGTKIFSNI